MNIKKRFISLIIVFAIVVTCSIPIGSNAYAADQAVSKSVHAEYAEYVHKLESLDFNNPNDMKIIRELNNNLSDEAAQMYSKNLIKNVNEVLEGGIEMPQNVSYIKKEFELDNGEKLVVELSDVPENQVSPYGSGSEHYVTYTGYKDYGDRLYEVTVYLHTAYGTIYLTTRNHYTISNAGLNVRKVSHYAHSSTAPILKVTGSSSRISDEIAPVVGHDINVEATAKARRYDEYGLPTNNVYELKADNRVKLLELDKKGKKAKVMQHVYAYMSY